MLACSGAACGKLVFAELSFVAKAGVFEDEGGNEDEFGGYEVVWGGAVAGAAGPTGDGA